MGCPLRSSLEVELLGEVPGGMPVVMHKYAYAADAFVVVNRVKPHTEFTHPFESGLMKMIALGMGKEFGATVYHRYFLRGGYGATIEPRPRHILSIRHPGVAPGHGVPADSRASCSMRMCWLISSIIAWLAGERLVGSRVMTAKVSMSGGSRLTQVSFLV